MNDFSEKMKQRLFLFAVECGKLCVDFQDRKMFYAYSNQLIRSSASVGANYRAACRAK